MFLDYSRHGYNLSSTVMIHKYNLSVEAWHAIKNTLRLYKDSNIVSPYTLETVPPEELKAYVDEQMSKLFRNNIVIENSYNKILHREYKKTIQENNFKHLEINAFIDNLVSELPKLKSIELKRDNNKSKKVKEAIVVLADLHIGAENEEGTIQTLKYNTEIIKEKLNEVSKIVNENNYSNVDIVFLGDLIESFTGMNHKNSWKGIQKGLWGSQVLISSYEIISKFISDIYNFRKIYMVGGNHDRSTSDNKEDTTAEILKIFSFFLSKIIGEEKVQNFGQIGSFSLENINIIMSHGHLGITKDPAPSIAWKYGKQGMFNLVLQGHLHSRIIPKNNDGIDFRKIYCPPLFPGNQYSEDLGYSSSSGFLIIEPFKNGLPLIKDYSI